MTGTATPASARRARKARDWLGCGEVGIGKGRKIGGIAFHGPDGRNHVPAEANGAAARFPIRGRCDGVREVCRPVWIRGVRGALGASEHDRAVAEEKIQGQSRVLHRISAVGYHHARCFWLGQLAGDGGHETVEIRKGQRRRIQPGRIDGGAVDTGERKAFTRCVACALHQVGRAECGNERTAGCGVGRAGDGAAGGNNRDARVGKGGVGRDVGGVNSPL